MDSTTVKLLRYKRSKATNFKLYLEIDSLTLRIERTWLKNVLLTNENTNLQLIIDKTDERLDVQEKIYETDLEAWKIKSKGKLKVFIYVIGALIITLLTAI